MSITIKSHSLLENITPVASVFNPINFVVDSTMRGREGFSYVADIYQSGTTVSGSNSLFVTRLYSYPNLINYYGLFDVHKPLSSYVSSDKYAFSSGILTVNTQTTRRFQVKFGESFSTKNNFTSFAQGPLLFGSSYYLKVNFPQPHNLVGGDGVYLVKDDITIDSALNNISTRVLSANSTTQVTLEAVYGTGGTAQTGYVYEGASFSATTSTGGFLTMLTKTPHNFSVGDSVVIAKYVTVINPEYDGAWTVKSVSSSTIFTVNSPYGDYTLNESGTVYKKGNKMLTGLTVSTGFTFFNNSVDDYGVTQEFGRAREFSAFTLNSAQGGFLTNTDTFRVRENDGANLSFLYGGLLSSTTANMFVYTFVDYSGNTYTNTYDFPSSYTGTSNPDWVNFSLPTGPANISNMISFGSLVGDLTAITWSNIDYYSVLAYKKFTAPMSKPYRYIVDNNCTKYQVYRFMFKNRLGAFDYFNFTKRNDTSFSIEKSTYERQLGGFFEDDFGYIIGEAQTIVNNVKLKEKVTAYSDWITEDEAAWLYELFGSPEVYVLNGSYPYPVVITSNEYVVGKRVNQKMINYKIDFEYAFEKFSQRG